ncbi:helix-turn-helix domain-containing protein [Streptomyces sp. NBC_01477]|uniref:helix-turn-helix domain-containing protein n=1 Tax=Streptomyces sp. NBC_01477 TaxID=2976015 RepID=UPI002E34B0D7|nr:helix-turn-helix domain-containing protein [Streptomyces sp. NBC_01477]
MGQWEPLADRIPLDMRRLATQLRRMKDRSGLTVPALAARTAESAEAWAGYLAARTVAPLAAVEVLAQACGADYDRIGALWKLADKASTGTGDRGRGKPLPLPDPLDPLTAEDGLPARRRRIALLAVAGLLAVAALLAVVLMAGTSNGRAPGRDAGPTVGAPTATASASARQPRDRTPASGAHVPGHGSATPGGTAPPVPPAASTAPVTGEPVAPGAGTTTPPPVHGTPAPTGAASPTPSSRDTPTPTATPSPTHTGLCLGLIVLGICVG